VTVDTRSAVDAAELRLRHRQDRFRRLPRDIGRGANQITTITYHVFVTKIAATGKTLTYCNVPRWIALATKVSRLLLTRRTMRISPAILFKRLPSDEWRLPNNSCSVPRCFSQLGSTPLGRHLTTAPFSAETGNDSGQGIAVDSSGSAYIAGDTASSDFPVTTGAFQTKAASTNEAFVTKLSATGAAVELFDLPGWNVDGRRQRDCCR